MPPDTSHQSLHKTLVPRCTMSIPFTEHLLTLPGHYPRRSNPIGRRNPARAPSAFELYESPAMQAALRQAWVNSKVNDIRLQHEEGGWVYMSLSTGELRIQLAPAGSVSHVELGNPPRFAGMVLVATFHSHPNRDFPGPSGRDLDIARYNGVPGIIRAPNGDHLYGLEGRRHDLLQADRYPTFPP
jgi:hypothetical protein